MKKTILFLLLILSSYTIVANVLAKNELLPKDALRMRVVANSNSTYDQNVKTKVKQEIELELFQLLEDTATTEKAREKVKLNLDKIEKKVQKVLLQEQYPFGYKVQYGQNYFPEKIYKGVTYEEGYYEYLVITLGKGEGNNFWCVMFPPLCMMETDDISDVEYKSLVKELINKYL